MSSVFVVSVCVDVFADARPGSTEVLDGAKHPQTKSIVPVKAVIMAFQCRFGNYPVCYDLRSRRSVSVYLQLEQC